ncbi:MAG: M12 family metallo-peptidase [Saprospiraceae bacterium]|nr:T9SS type A sorting domain-containing protein [Lewinella sp.]
MRIPGPKLVLLVILVVFGHNLTNGQLSIPFPWQESFSPHRSFDLDQDQFQQLLAGAPSRWDKRNADAPVTVSLPLPDEGTAVFEVWRSEQMAPGLATVFPNIQTFFGQDRDDHRRNIYILTTAQYVKVLYFDQNGMNSRLEPATPSLPNYHFSYRKNWGRTPGLANACDAEPDEDEQGFRDLTAGEARRGETKMYRYRMALATTGEYGSYHGTTKEEVLAAMNELLLQVNAIFERESSIHFDLVEGNELLIFLDPENDPYDNSDVEQMMETNKMVCNYSIGYPNYDIGHVLSTKFGGQAHIGSLCNFSRKAKAFTGLGQPEGYYMGTIFAHELAHQIGARHTQSNDCNRDIVTAYEPGSGSTIMAYAGICAPNVQELPDDYFHGNSLELIAEKAALGIIFGCVPGILTDNLPPQVEAGPDLYIPIGTPFLLKGEGTDPDGDSLLYLWEQMDALTEADSLNLYGPIFRSRPPTTSPERAVGANETAWEALPDHRREARFRLTAKDLHLGLGSSVYDEMTVHFIDSIGPFTVLSPTAKHTKWEVGTLQTITWDEAGTSHEPVLCQTVDIYLSSDGGQHYDILLAAQVPNTGSAQVSVPYITGDQFRVKVSCSNGSFFDSSDRLLEIYDPNAPIPADTMMVDTTTVMPPDSSDMVIDTTIVLPPTDTLEQPVPDTLDLPMTDTINTPLPDTLQQPVEDTTSSPPIDTTVTIPMDSLNPPPMDTVPNPPDDTMTELPMDTLPGIPPIDTVANPPPDTLIDPPMDTVLQPPTDTMDMVPIDSIPSAPGDTLISGEPDTLIFRPEENPVDTLTEPGNDPPMVLPPPAEDECPDCPPRVSLFPNPTGGILFYHIKLDQGLDGILEIISSQGHLLQRKPISFPPGQNDLRLDLSSFPSGVYRIRLLSKDYVLVKPVVLRSR